MTLNLMLTSPSAGFLSGDFRISTMIGQKVVRHSDSFDTQKLIPVFKFHWSALVAFTGIAVAPRIGDVGDWLSRELHAIAMDAPFQVLPDRLTEAGSWLGLLTGEPGITFSIVGFAARRPYALLISNYLDEHGRVVGRRRAGLSRFEWKPKRPDVRVAGDGSAVLPEELSNLKKMLASNRPPKEIQRVMAEVNASAAGRSEVISRECVTGHLLASGTAEITPHGINEGTEYVPSFVKRSLSTSGIEGFVPKIDALGQPLPARWKGTTAALRKTHRSSEFVAVVHAFSNVAEPFGPGPVGNGQLFWKIAEENEPRTVRFEVHDR